MDLVWFHEYLRLHVDGLPYNHFNVALSFHKIGRSYEGSWKFYQAIESYKKALWKNNMKIATTLQHLILAYLSASKIDSHNMEETDNGENNCLIEWLDKALSVLVEHIFGGNEEHTAVLFYKGFYHAARDDIDLALLRYEG